MSRVVLIGGTGHVGTYLVPRLVEAGHDVVVVSRAAARTLPAPRSLERGGTCRHRPQRGRGGGHVRRADPRPGAGSRDRHDLLHRGERAPSGRGAARPGAALPALRHDLGARPQRRRAHRWRRSRAARSATTASAKRRSKPICWTRRGATASRPPCCIRVTSCGPGWTPVNPAGNFNPDVFRRLAHGRGSGCCPTWAWRRCTMCTRTTWRRRSCRRWRTGARRSARRFTSCRRRRSRCAAMQRRWRPGSAKRPTLRYLPWEEWRHGSGEEAAQRHA